MSDFGCVGRELRNSSLWWLMGGGGLRSEGDVRMQSTARAVQGAEASQGHPSERAWVARVPAPPCHRAPQTVPQRPGSER